MNNETYSIPVLVVVNGKNIKGTLTLSVDSYEFNDTKQSINWENAFCKKGTAKVKSFIFSSEKPYVVICTPEHNSPAFVIDQTQVSELIAKVDEFGEIVKQKRIKKAERERKVKKELERRVKTEQERFLAALLEVKKVMEEKFVLKQESESQTSPDKQQTIVNKTDNNPSDKTNSANIPDEVTYAPGSEPEKIKKRLDRFFEKLDREYPDKFIVGLSKEHKNWGETLTDLYRQLGYPNRNSFLNAYGYTVGTAIIGKKSSTDAVAIMERLKELYPEGTSMSCGELQKANPDIPWKTLSNRSREFFGTTLSKHLKKEGILTSGRETGLSGTGDEKEDAEHSVQNGALQGDKNISVEDKLAAVENALLEKYKGKENLPKSIKQIKDENKELKLSNIEALVLKVKGVSAKEYFVNLGILPGKMTPEEKLNNIINVLKERHVGTDKKVYTVTELVKQNPDLPISSLKPLIKEVHNKPQTEYLLSIGILSRNEWQVAVELEKERIKAQEAARNEKFHNDLSFEDMYNTYLESYKKQTVENPFFDFDTTKLSKKEENHFRFNNYSGSTSEETPDGFVINRCSLYGKPYVELCKYNGSTEIVQVPDCVTKIGYNMIFSNNNIKKIIIPSNVTNVSKDILSDKVRKNIADKDGFCIIGGYLVDYSGNAKEVIIPEGVEKITARAFFKNTSITTVYLPKSIKIIGEQAFSKCDHLFEIVFNSETEIIDSIEDSAFSECSSLKKINLPKAIKELGDEVFYGCDILNKNTDFKAVGNILLSYAGDDTDVSVPEGITVIGSNAFQGDRIKKIMLPDGVKSICSKAFSGAKYVRVVSIPESVETIGVEAFSGCCNLRNVNLSGVTEIGEKAFYNCHVLKDIVLSEKLERIESGVFGECSALCSICVKGAHGVEESIFPRGLKEIGDSAFYLCDSLEEITVPSSVKKIGARAFYLCRSLTKAIMEEGIEEIGDEAFGKTLSLLSFNIPLSVKSIGKDAFFCCNCIKDVVLPEAFVANKAYYGIPDKNNCFVEDGILLRCASVKEDVVRISDGVIVIDRNALYEVFSRCWKQDLSQIILPDSVRVIYDNYYGASSRYRMNIPCGYLLQKYKLPIEPLEKLLDSVWKYEAGMMDWVAVYIYQNNKQLSEYCKEAFSKAPNAFVVSAMIVLGDKCKSNDVDKIGDIVFDLRKDIGQEFIDRFYSFAKEHKSKKAMAALASLASPSVTGKVNVKKEYNNDIEKFCYNNYEKYEFERIMKRAGLSEKIFEKTGVKYSDGEEKVSAFVLECAILPYVGQLIEKPRNIGSYKTEYSSFSILKDSDQIASGFEKNSFNAFIGKIIKYAGGYSKPQIWIPVYRFGSGDQVKTLISSMNGWSNWNKCGSSGRMGIMVCKGAVMLSDSREAMIYAEKCKCLNHYAELRGTTADFIRDTKLADFGFDNNGKKLYDLGGTVIEASVGDDLSIVLFDTNASKVVKSLPKKNCDTAKYDACSADYSELKKNVKKVVKSRNDLLFEYFLSGKRFDSTSWIAVYTNNPVLNKVAKLLVWSQDKQTFTLSDTGAIDSFGNDFSINSSDKIVVAHPLEMDDADIVRWQKYFAERKLKQPFEQIWEPKIKGEIQEDRYAGCMIPYYRFLHQEKHGITVEDNDFHNQIDILIQDCEADIARIDWARHKIDVNDRFEIESFRLVKLNRRTNHIVYYLDKCTMFGKIEQDDESALQNLGGYTVTQIDSFLKFAIEKGSKKCAAALKNYKNEHFADFSDIDDFVLDS